MAFSIQWTDFPEEFDDFTKTQALNFDKPLPSYENLDHHIFIEGDNYPVLQKLSESYTNKINLIYIDPPYNTGNAFTYNDKFGQTQDRHSKWLSFMNRRLSLAKNMLKNDGCIFIAIDQSELYTLKLLCDQIFGEDNFVNDFMWLHGKGKKDSWSRTLQQHTLCYAKCKKDLKPFEEIETTQWGKNNADNDPRGNWFSGSVSFTEKRSNPQHPNYFSITSPSGIVWTRQWQRTKKEMDELIKDNRIYWGLSPKYDKVPRVKIFNSDISKIIPKNIIADVESTRNAQTHLDLLLGEKAAFDNPKPVGLIEHLIEITQMPEDSLIMDFFAGSGTTFEAVCNLNKKDGGKRKSILIQKPEKPLKESSFDTIADLCWKRIQTNAAESGDIVEKIRLL